MRSVFTAEFDWDKNVPVGKSLGDKAVMRLQVAGGTYYVSTYQETSTGSSDLRTVEEFEGKTRKRLIEFAPA